MTKLNQNNKPISLSRKQTKAKSGDSSGKQGYAIVAEPRMNTGKLIKRVNALITHVGDLDGGVEAEKNSRETSTHIKNIKEIIALNESIHKTQAPTEKSYTPEEEQAMAAELVALIFKHGGFK